MAKATYAKNFRFFRVICDQGNVKVEELPGRQHH